MEVRSDVYNLNNDMKPSQLLILLILLLAVVPPSQAQINMATCKTSSDDSSQCMQCRDHFHLHEGLCYVDIMGCEEYVHGNICRKCSNGYILVNNECCDKMCMSKIYLKLQNSIENQVDQEEARKKAEIEGYEKSVSVLAKNSIKIGQNYEIVSTKSQYFDNIYRYQVKIDIQNKLYIGILDYNVETKQSSLVDLSLETEPIQPEINLNEENIHSNQIYERGYKYIYMKYGLELYELSFQRMTALHYGRTTELKFVFVGPAKASIISIIVGPEEIYTLWKEEKTNVVEITQYIENLKQIETVSKEQSFQAVLSEVLTEKQLNRNDVELVNITAVSKEEYIFVVFIKSQKIRYVIRAAYNSKTQSVSIKKIEQVFHPKLQEIKEPEKPETKVIEKQSVSSNPEAREAFDYLYKVRPSFRQTQVDAVKIQTGNDIKTITIMETKDNKVYRVVILKDQKTNELQLVDESAVMIESPKTTIVETKNDGTTSIITNSIDYTQNTTKTIITALKQNNIDTTTNKISSLETVEGPNSIQYTLVLGDLLGNPTKQVTISQDKQSSVTTLIDVTSIDKQVNYIVPVTEPVISIPSTQFYKQEIKDLVTLIQHNSQESVVISKIKKIDVINTTLVSKYELTVENAKGEELIISAIQDKADQSVQVISVNQASSTINEAVQTVEVTNTKKVDSYGVSIEYTNDKTVLSTDQNINVALTYISSQLQDYQNYEVVSSLTKTYTQNQQQTIILSNGQQKIQVTGNIDIKTLRYIPIELKPIPLSISYPVTRQNTIPMLIYPSYIKEHKEIKDSESVLIEKYKVFKGKIPTSVSVEQFSETIKTTYNYEISSKKFVAIVDYNTTSKTGKVIEMNPVQENVVPISVETTEVNGQVITVSNSVEEIQTINTNTQTVISTINTMYPLMKKYNVTSVKVIESHLTDTFEVSYFDQTTNLQTVIITTSSKDGQTISIQDINTKQSESSSVISSSETVVISTEEYQSTQIQDIISYVDSNTMSIDNITKITAQIQPTYVVYNIEAISNGKKYDIVLVEKDNVKEVLAVHTTEQTKKEEKIDVQRVDVIGNVITETNDVKFIKESQNVQISVKNIVEETKDLGIYDVKYVQTTDYGQLQQIAITFEHQITKTSVQSVVFFNKTDKSVDVVSVTPIQAPHPGQPSDPSPAPHPVSFIPGFAVPNAVQSDKGLQTVITTIHSSNTQLTTATTVSAEVQTISENVTKYTVVLDSNGEKTQAVYVWNPTTQVATQIVLTSVPENITSYYLTTTSTSEGTVIKSNSVSEITIKHPQITSILAYTSEQQIISEDSVVNSISLTTSSESATYTIQVTENHQQKTVTINKDLSTNTIKLIDFNIAPAVTVYPKPTEKLTVDLVAHKQNVEEFISIIQKSSVAGLQNVKQVISITKQSEQNYDQYYLEVINMEDLKYFVTVGGITGTTMNIIDVVQEVETITTTPSINTHQVDHWGNTITETTQTTEIVSDYAAQVSIQEIIKQNVDVQSYHVVSLKKIDYGTVQEIHLQFGTMQDETISVQSVVFFNKTDKSVDVVSVTPIQAPHPGQPSDPSPAPHPVSFIPGFAVPNAVQSDKGLQTVITTIHSSNTQLTTATTVSAEVQTISENVTKYTVVLDSNGEKTQAVYVWNPTTQVATPIVVSPIPTHIQPVYIKQETTSEGATVLSTNNITYISQTISDFKNVSSFITSATGATITSNTTHIQVTSQSNLNTYKIIIQDNVQSKSITVNYDTTASKSYLISYQQKISEAQVAPTQYTQVKTTVDEKLQYLSWLKTIDRKDISTPINIISIQSNKNALYTETILQVETKTSSNVFIKTIKSRDSEQSTIISVTSAAVTQQTQSEQIRTDSLSYLTHESTSRRTDNNGNTVTESIDSTIINSNEVIQSVYTYIISTFTQYHGYKIKYIKTVRYAKLLQVVITLQGVYSTDAPIQVVAFYDETSKSINVVNIQEIAVTDQVITSTPYPKPIFTPVVVPQHLIANVVKTDSGLQTVITQITTSSQQLKNASILSAQIQQYNQTIIQYNVVVEVKGQKQEFVHIVDKQSKIATPITVSPIAAEIRPIVYTETKIQEQSVIITNRIQTIQQAYPQASTTVDVFISENPTVPSSKIESFIVTPESQTTTVSIIARNEQQTSYIFNKYVTTDSKEIIKVDSHTVPVMSIIKAKPIISTPIPTSEITSITQITKQLIKIINVDTTKTLDTSKIISIQKSHQSTVDVYHINTVDTTNQTVQIQVIYNPSTQGVSVVDVSKVVEGLQTTLTQTVVQEYTGKSNVLTNNIATIKQSKQFKKISDFISKNHPNDTALTTSPQVETTEKYQRASIKTIAFSQENKTIQGTYLIDQRTNTTIELGYHVIPASIITTTLLPVTIPTISYTSSESIAKVIQQDAALINTINVIQKVDFSLVNSTPIFIEINNYTTTSTITLVYQTPTSNSRVLTYFNPVTAEAKVVDYTKVAKIIEASQTVERINELGQTAVFTTNTKTITTTDEFKTVFTAAVKQVPALSNKQIKGVETTIKQKGKEYTIITIDNGIVSQVILQSDSATGEVTFISEVQSNVATQILASLPQPQEKTKLDIETIQSTMITEISSLITTDKTLNLTSATIISGTVTQNNLVQIYDLTLQTENYTTKVVKITKDLKTKDILINNIKQIHQKAPVQIKTTTKQNSYGQIETITNSYEEITTTEEISTIIKFIKIKKPQFISAKPITSKTVTYGEIIESTLVFADDKKITKMPIQITSIINKKTGVVEIIDTKQINVQDTYPTAPIVPVQCIPAPAIKIAAKKNPEITQILTLVQSVTTSTTQIESLTVQDLGNVKKYIAIVAVPTGKQHLVYYFDKETTNLRLVNNQAITATNNPLVYSESVNQYGETVITSTSVEKITSKVTEVTTAINLLTTTYQTNISNTIKSVSSKGTTVKEIKVVTVDASQQEVVHTVLVDTASNIVKIIDVTQGTSPKPAEKPKSDQEGEGEKGELGIRVTPTAQKNIKAIIESDTKITEKFTNTTIESIYSSSTSFTNTYIVTIKDTNNVKANVTLIQNPAEPIQVINIQPQTSETTVTHSDIVTQTTTSTVTGEVKVITNDKQTIQSDSTIIEITKNLIKTQPHLSIYTPVSTQSISYGNITQTTITLESEGEVSVQATTFFNSTTNSVQIVSIKNVEKDHRIDAHPATSVQTIPAPAIRIAAKRMTEISQIITSVQTVTTSTTQIETLTVEDYPTVKKYIAIAPTPTGKHQSVFIFDKNTQQLKEIASQPLPNIESPVNIEVKTSKWGEQTISSNNVEILIQKYPQTAAAISVVDTFFNQEVTNKTQSIQITQHNSFVEYKVVVQVDSINQQITVTKQNGDLKIKNVQSLTSQEQSDKATTEEVKQTKIVDTTASLGTQIQQFIQSSTPLTASHIVSINATDNLVSILYTVYVKDSNNKITVLQILSETGENFTLIGASEVQSSTISESVAESVTLKQVNQITGHSVITTTDSSIIQNTQNQLFISEIAKNIPSLENATPALIQTTAFGNFIEKTFVIHQQNTTLQLTTLYNKTSQTITVVDSKNLTINKSADITQPVTDVSVISAPLITASATQITEISEIITQIKTTTSKKEISLESISIQDYGNVKKYIAVLPTPTNKQQFVYLYDKSKQTLQLLDNFTVPLGTQTLIYQESINKFGEITVESNSIKEVTSTIPAVSTGLEYISVKYPSITPAKIDYVQTVEYPSFYQSKITADSQSSNSVTVVINIDKETKTVTEVSTYSASDVHTEHTKKADQVTDKAVVPLTSGELLTNLTKFISASKEIPVNDVQMVLSATTTTTIFGTQVITIQAISSDLTKVEVIINYNPVTQAINLNNFVVLETSPTSKEAVTQFKVDVLTGTKSTTTNDTTVITSSEITTTLVKELQQSKSVLAQQVIISSTTVEYPDKVKVISIFAPEPSATELTQVTSIFDKLTASIRVIETSQTTISSIQSGSSTERQIFTNTEIHSAQIKIPSMSTTKQFIKKEFPIYINQNPSSVIVEQMENIDFISYIYDSATTNTQVVVMFNKTSGESTLLESNPIPQNIQAFFYQEKRNDKGESVITSNNLTEVIQRVPKTQILQTYISEQLQIKSSDIKTVESVIGSTFNYYTIVTNEQDGIKQYEFTVNTQKDEIKQVESKKLPEINSVVLPHYKPSIQINPQSETILPFINSVIDSSISNLTSVHEIVSISKLDISNTNIYEIEYVNKQNNVSKLVVQSNEDSKPIFIDEMPITPQFVPQPAIVVSEKIDSVTKTTETTYHDVQTFQIDSNSQHVIQYIAKNIPQVSNYTLESARKTVYGQIEQYDILYKSADKAPLQISIANDNNNQNLLLLQNKKITEPEQKNILESSVSSPKAVEVSDIEKENIKVLSKLGLVKDVKQYIEVSLQTIDQNQQFVSATEAVKQAYSVLLKESVIIKVLEKKSMESDSVKVFFKSKDQIYEASIEINPITAETKLTDFIKIGTQTTSKSEVNVYADLCYGYQVIEDVTIDANIDFLMDYLKKKYDTLRDASLTEAQSIVLESGRINYKFYFKKDTQTIKYIVYYEPEYKRVLEVKGTSFSIGDKYTFVPREQQITDPYFRKLDTYIRQNRDQLNSASVLHTENKDNGQNIQFRTIYTSAGKTYRSIASINKDNQNINESGLNEIIEIPTEDGPADIGQNEEALSVTKLDIHDLGKNLYFTEAHRYIQSKYQSELDKAQLLGASGKANLFSYIFKEFYMVDDKILTVSAEYNPITQKATIVSEPEIIDIQTGYFPVTTDKKLTEVRNWLKEKNLDLSSAVMISSESKQILFGSAYKIVFKDMTKYYTYVVYYDTTTREIRILFEKDSTDLQAQKSQGEGESSQETPSAQIEPKLKGFARPQPQKTTAV